MKIKFKVTSFCTMIFFSLIFSQKAIRAEEQQWQPVPEANYAEVLELIAMRTKANYEEISSWQGRMYIHENIHFYGTNAAKKARAVDTNSIAQDSQHICAISNTIADFVIDMRNDKLYSSVEPNVQYKSIDLDRYVPIRKNTRTPMTKTILSPDSYMWYMPDEIFAPKLPPLRAQKTVFVESSQNKNVKGFVRDPRLFFELEGHKKIWETLLQRRSNVNERIKERIAGYPHIEISSLDTDSGIIKYRILTTWKASESYYLRSLLEVDEAVGFNAIKTETTNPDGVRRDLKEYTYVKIADIYIPKTIKKEQRNNKGEITLSSEITIETTGLNTPLPEDTFTIKNLGLEDGTLITDKITDTEFRYSKGALVPITEPNEPPN